MPVWRKQAAAARCNGKITIPPEKAMKRLTGVLLTAVLCCTAVAPSFAGQKENRSIGENQQEAKRAARQQQKYAKKQAKRQKKMMKQYQKQQKKAAKHRR